MLNSNDASAVVLAILCDFEGKDKQEVVNTLLKRLKSLSDETEYKNYLKMVNILSTNRNLEDEVAKGAEMLSVDIEQTPFYKMAEKRGVQKGIFETAIRMIEKFNLSIDEVIKELNIKKDELLEYMQSKEGREKL